MKKNTEKTEYKDEYKFDDFEDCVIHLAKDGTMKRKFRGGTEHDTSTKESKLAMDVSLRGKNVSKAFYDSF